MCSGLGKAGFQIRVLKFAVSVLSSQVTGLLAAYSGRQFFAVLVAQSDGGLGLRRGGGGGGSGRWGGGGGGGGWGGGARGGGWRAPHGGSAAPPAACGACSSAPCAGH